ncbi:hypothetical protein [Kitasatospora griseola]|uniref:hypothetical protein n=1 Tax=Kitasatospora griseola TaxID=2064 RepID=UPI00167059D8|nr:hypothetical protein [Kitasatospora griseola]GGQ67742.1 hypothetical protein GCM10010195_24240 [Kitasatospora griseola]
MTPPSTRAADTSRFQRFDIAPPTAAARTCARAGGGLTAEQWRTFLPGIPYRKTCP